MRLSIDLAEAACHDRGSDALYYSETDLNTKLEDITIGHQTNKPEGGECLQYQPFSSLRNCGRLEFKVLYAAAEGHSSNSLSACAMRLVLNIIMRRGVCGGTFVSHHQKSSDPC